MIESLENNTDDRKRRLDGSHLSGAASCLCIRASLPLRMDRTNATTSNKIEDSSAACMPSTNEVSRELLRLNPVPKNI